MASVPQNMKEVPLWDAAIGLNPAADWKTHPIAQVLNPVAILTARNVDSTKHNGTTVGWVMWASAFPALVVVSVGTFRHPLIEPLFNQSNSFS